MPDITDETTIMSLSFLPFYFYFHIVTPTMFNLLRINSKNHFDQLSANLIERY